MVTTDGRRARPPRPPIGLLARKLDSLINERFEGTLRGPATIDALTTAIAPFLDQTVGETARALRFDGERRARDPAALESDP